MLKKILFEYQLDLFTGEKSEYIPKDEFEQILKRKLEFSSKNDNTDKNIKSFKDVYNMMDDIEDSVIQDLIHGKSSTEGLTSYFLINKVISNADILSDLEGFNNELHNIKDDAISELTDYEIDDNDSDDMLFTFDDVDLFINDLSTYNVIKKYIIQYYEDHLDQLDVDKKLYEEKKIDVIRIIEESFEQPYDIAKKFFEDLIDLEDIIDNIYMEVIDEPIVRENLKNSFREQDINIHSMLSTMESYKEEINGDECIYIERSITTGDQESINENLGIFWSYEKDKAEAYQGSLSDEYTIKLYGYAPISSVNWQNTFYKSLYELNYEYEAELKEGALLYIDRIYFDGGARRDGSVFNSSLSKVARDMAAIYFPNKSQLRYSHLILQQIKANRRYEENKEIKFKNYMRSTS